MKESSVVEILLVEDNEQDRELTLHALRKAKLANHIHLAQDGVEALEFLFGEGSYAGKGTRETPKLVILDLKLPKIDGLEVLQRIKSDPRTKTIPVIMLTSSKEHQDIIESYNLGVNSYIVKPVNFESFTVSVQELGMYWLVLNQPPVAG
jgi:two-component system, response regulator